MVHCVARGKIKPLDDRPRRKTLLPFNCNSLIQSVSASGCNSFAPRWLNRVENTNIPAGIRSYVSRNQTRNKGEVRFPLDPRFRLSMETGRTCLKKSL